jgi:hypothetical protein
MRRAEKGEEGEKRKGSSVLRYPSSRAERGNSPTGAFLNVGDLSSLQHFVPSFVEMTRLHGGRQPSPFPPPLMPSHRSAASPRSIRCIAVRRSSIEAAYEIRTPYGAPNASPGTSATSCSSKR